MSIGIVLNRVVIVVLLVAVCATASFAQDDDIDVLAFAVPGMALEPKNALLLGYARVHCALARRACKLSPKQEAGLLLLNSDWIQTEVKKATDTPGRQKVRGIVQFLRANVLRANVVRAPQPANQPQDIIQAVRKIIDQHIAELLDDPQKQEFEKQKELRDAFRREALSAVIIAALDQHLFLSAQQRDDLLTPIAEWEKTQDVYWQFYFQNQSYIPDIPERILASHLDENQLKSLRGMNKTFIGMAQMQMQLVQEQNFVIEK